jgi:hypothetical protein
MKNALDTLMMGNQLLWDDKIDALHWWLWRLQRRAAEPTQRRGEKTQFGSRWPILLPLNWIHYRTSNIAVYWLVTVHSLSVLWGVNSWLQRIAGVSVLVIKLWCLQTSRTFRFQGVCLQNSFRARYNCKLVVLAIVHLAKYIYDFHPINIYYVNMFIMNLLMAHV